MLGTRSCMTLAQVTGVSAAVSKAPRPTPHRAHLRLPAWMLRLNQAPTAFEEKASWVHGEVILGTFDIRPIPSCDPASWREEIPLKKKGGGVGNRGNKKMAIFSSSGHQKRYFGSEIRASILLLASVWHHGHTAQKVKQVMGQNGQRRVSGTLLAGCPSEPKFVFFYDDQNSHKNVFKARY